MRVARRTRKSSTARAAVVLAVVVLFLPIPDDGFVSPARGAEPQAKGDGKAPAARGAAVEYGMPKGWFGGSANAGAFESGIDGAVVHGGKAAAFVRMNGDGPGEFGTLMQSIAAAPYVGKRVRLSAFIKTRDATNGAALWMRIDGNGAMLAFDNMDARRIKGTTDWTRAEIVLDVAHKSRAIAFGIILSATARPGSTTSGSRPSARTWRPRT